MSSQGADSKPKGKLMIHYEGHTISAEFAGIGRPPVWRVRKLAANGVTGDLRGAYPTPDLAKIAIDDAAIDESWRAAEEAAEGRNERKLYGCEG